MHPLTHAGVEFDPLFRLSCWPVLQGMKGHALARFPIQGQPDFTPIRADVDFMPSVFVPLDQCGGKGVEQFIVIKKSPAFTDIERSF